MIQTTSIDKIRRLRNKKKIIQGGSSSGKTYAILIILIDRCIKVPKQEVSVVSESMPHLRRGALRDFLKIMKETNRYKDNYFNKTNLIYTFSNGSYIEFFSADQPDKLKGARRDVLYINECNSIAYDAYNQLAIRTRGDIYLDYNPDRKFWVHTDVMHEMDSDFIILKYTDNEALDKSIIQQFELAREKAYTSSYWANWVKVYVDGELGSLEGVVFQNWDKADFLPPESKLLGVGLDFGYTNDPSAAVGLYYCNDTYYIDEILYRKGLNNSQLANILIDEVGNSAEVYCDSAEPKSIAELKRYGLKAYPAKNIRNSISYSIDLIQTYNFKVTARSKNVIEELENYTWKKNKTGETLNEPIDIFNHSIDAMRYVFMNKMSKKSNNKAPFIIQR